MPIYLWRMDYSQDADHRYQNSLARKQTASITELRFENTKRQVDQEFGFVVKGILWKQPPNYWWTIMALLDRCFDLFEPLVESTNQRRLSGEARPISHPNNYLVDLLLSAVRSLLDRCFWPLWTSRRTLISVVRLDQYPAWTDRATSQWLYWTDLSNGFIGPMQSTNQMDDSASQCFEKLAIYWTDAFEIH